MRGRNVLIGATAIEMGDRYPVPLRGVLPGVTIQALAAETLLAGTPSRGMPLVPYAVALLLAALVVGARDSRAGAWRLAGALVVQIALVLAAQRFLAIHYSMGLGNVMLCAAAALVVARDILTRFREAVRADEETGLPNHRAFQARATTPGAAAVVQVTNLEALTAVLGGDQLAQALVRTAERLRLASADATVYRISGHQLALVLTTSQ
ncbi:CHASE2 domain-containing protein [Sphingomonas sp. MMS24-JH45]